MNENDGVGDMMLWARAHAGGMPSDRAAVRATALAPGPFEGTVRHPFPTANREEYIAAVETKGIARRSLSAPVGTIQIAAIKGIQQTVNRERLGQHLADPRLIPEGARASGSGTRIDLPIVVKLGGEYYLHDGHHRLTAAHLRGETTARVRLIDLDAVEV